MQHLDSNSFQIAKQFLGKEVEIMIDRPRGSKHPEHEFVYEVNYGYLPGVKAPDGEDLDAYYLGIDMPITHGVGIVKAIIHRLHDDDDKLVVMPDNVVLSAEEIEQMVAFQEQWFEHELVVAKDFKRKISLLIPYRVNDGHVFVFLQKRAKDAKRLPDYFGFFGGGAKGNESPEETLQREIKEEMDFVPTGYNYFRKYEFELSIKDFFILETPDDFERGITILEGEYGKWFSKEVALNEPMIIDEDKIVLNDFFRHDTNK